MENVGALGSMKATTIVATVSALLAEETSTRFTNRSPTRVSWRVCRFSCYWSIASSFGISLTARSIFKRNSVSSLLAVMYGHSNIKIHVMHKRKHTYGCSTSLQLYRLLLYLLPGFGTKMKLGRTSALRLLFRPECWGTSACRINISQYV